MASVCWSYVGTQSPSVLLGGHLHCVLNQVTNPQQPFVDVFCGCGVASVVSWSCVLSNRNVPSPRFRYELVHFPAKSLAGRPVKSV